MASSRLDIIVRPALPRDAAAIDRMRVDGYAAATWFKLEDTRKVMLENDPPGTQVVVAESARAPHELLATVAFVLVEDTVAAETHLGCPLPARAWRFPASVAMRGAVHLAHRGRRLNHLLRYYAIDAARRSGLPQMLSAQAEGAPQRGVTARLGYEYTEVDKSRLATVGLPGSMFLVRLPAPRYDTALAGLQGVLGETLAASMWEGEPWRLAPPPACAGAGAQNW